MELMKIDAYPKIIQDIRYIGNHLAGVELITFSGKCGDVTTADGIFFDDWYLLIFQVAMQCIGKSGGEAVYPSPDDNQVLFVTVRKRSPVHIVRCACMASAIAPRTPA